MKPIKTFDDGTELHALPLMAGITAGYLIGIGLYFAKEKVSDIRMSRWAKKRGIPWRD